MYVPGAFALTDERATADLMARFDFALLVSTLDGTPFATHLPIMHEPDEGPRGTLYGHVARPNPHWQAFDGTSQAMAVFSGPHAYISPSWYPAREAVPTWNYVAVHAYGRPSVVDDPAAVRAHLAALVAKQESASPEPWTMDGLSERFVEGMLRGLVAFRMPIERVEAKAKLNQNHPPANRDGAIAGLRATGRPEDAAVADLMAAARDDA